MRRALLLLPLLLGGCSCQRTADDASVVDAAETTTEARASADDARRSKQALRAATVAALQAVESGAPDPARVVRSYVDALLRGDQATSNGFWSNGQRPPAGDDDILRDLRTLQDIRSVRIDAQAPYPIDPQLTPDLLQVDVRLRITSGEGVHRFQGYYRLQPAPDGSAWQLYAVSLQPALD